MDKKITVVFYPSGARLFKGDYKHDGNEPCLVNPKKLPLGVPMHFWKLKGDEIITPGIPEKARPQQIEEVKPVINQTIIQGITQEQLDSSNTTHSDKMKLIESKIEELSQLEDKLKKYTQECLSSLEKLLSFKQLEKVSKEVGNLDTSLSSMIQKGEEVLHNRMNIIEEEYTSLSKKSNIKSSKLKRILEIVGLSTLTFIIMHIIHFL